MGLSTHVLDLVTGRPAAGVEILASLNGELIGTFQTDEDGRCQDMLGDQPLSTGLYSLKFKVGAYLSATHVSVSEPPFFDEVLIQFVVSDTARHYHVPLLVSPYGYSTYRGS